MEACAVTHGCGEFGIVVTISAVGAGASRESSAAALSAFFSIGKVWSLDSDEERILLGCPQKRSYALWKRAPENALLARDTLERISYILGIYKALQVLLPKPQAADEWIRKPNTAGIFGGGSALERMLSGNVSDLYLVRNYLDLIKVGAS